MASPTRWTWVWVNSRSWWWTGRPGVLQFMRLQRVGHDWVTELNWIEALLCPNLSPPAYPPALCGHSQFLCTDPDITSLEMSPGLCQLSRLWPLQSSTSFYHICSHRVDFQSSLQGYAKCSSWQSSMWTILTFLVFKTCVYTKGKDQIQKEYNKT